MSGAHLQLLTMCGVWVEKMKTGVTIQTRHRYIKKDHGLWRDHQQTFVMGSTPFDSKLSLWLDIFITITNVYLIFINFF